MSMSNKHQPNIDGQADAADNGVTPVTMYYDSACVLCTSEAQKLQNRQPTDINLVPVNDGLEVLNKAGFSQEEAMTYICVQDSAGHWYTHMEGIRLLHKVAKTPWANILYLPIIKQLGDLLYPLVARNRYRIPNRLLSLIYGKEAVQQCQDGACRLPAHQRGERSTK